MDESFNTSLSTAGNPTNNFIDTENFNDSENLFESVIISTSSRNGDVIDIELNTHEDLELYSILLEFELPEIMMILKRRFGTNDIYCYIIIVNIKNFDRYLIIPPYLPEKNIKHLNILNIEIKNLNRTGILNRLF